MITEATLLRLFLDSKEIFTSYASYVKREALSYESKTILDDIQEYYSVFKTSEQIELEKFNTWFLQTQHPQLNEDKQKIYASIFQRLSQEQIDLEDEFVKTVLNHFRQEYTKDRIRELLDSSKLEPSEVIKELDDYRLSTGLLEEQDFVENDFNHVFVCKKRTEGLKWRLNCLNRSIGPLIAGDFGYIAAYVDTGKTKFLVSEVAYMAQQITDGSVLWFNNEGPEDRIQAQLLCAVLQANQEAIISHLDRAKAKYKQKLNGDENRIKIFDAVGFTPSMIREKAEKYNAKLIVIDMLDHIQIPGGNKNQEVIRLKNLYREIRDISKDFCPVLGSSQCDGSVTWTDNATGQAKFQHYIGMHQLDFSRSAKQAAAEFIITIGRDPEFPRTRYIHVPKNKLDGDGTGLSRNIKTEVIFDGQRNLYTD